MMKGISIAGAVLCTVLWVRADHDVDLTKVDISKLPPAASKGELTYQKDIKPLLEKSCTKCHGPEKPKGKLRLDSREAMLKGGESGPAVVPGQSAKSRAVIYASDLVEEMEMPPKDNRDKYPALSREQVGVLRAWVDQGAK